MRIVFMGTPAFAATCLRRIYGEVEVAGVYTKPDTPKNRGMKLAMSEVKELALEQGLPVFQPTTFRDDAVYEQLKALAPELIVVVAYGKILPQRVLDIPKYGCINIHGSLLPQLRGAAPVQWAVLNGLTTTGVSAMYLSAGMDEGDIISMRSTEVPDNETSEELMARLAEIGAQLLHETVQQIEAGTAPRTPQDNAAATYAPMLTKELCPVDWTKSARQIVRQIHGLNPWPVATAEINGEAFKLYRAEILTEHSGSACGTPFELTKKGLKIACADGSVLITQLQVSGGKRMSAADYFRGHPIKL